MLQAVADEDPLYVLSGGCGDPLTAWHCVKFKDVYSKSSQPAELVESLSKRFFVV